MCYFELSVTYWRCLYSPFNYKTLKTWTVRHFICSFGRGHFNWLDQTQLFQGMSDKYYTGIVQIIIPTAPF